MQDARDSALSIVKGHRVSELKSIGEEIYDEYMAERIWPGTRALAQAHLDAGQEGLAGHGRPGGDRPGDRPPPGPDRRAGHGGRVDRRRLHGQAGRRTAARPREGRGGTRTGDGGVPGPGPARAAYSDSHNDIPMLSLVGHPYAINPTPSCASTPASWSGACATTAPAARRPRSASPRPRASARWPAGPRRPSRCTAAAVDPIGVTYPRDTLSSPLSSHRPQHAL